MARTFELTGGISFRGFVEELAAQSEKAESTEAPVLEEASDGVRGSAVVAAVSPQFDLRRSLLGLRWDGWHRQALTLEIARGNTVDGSRWETRLQWSAAFP